VRSSNGNFLIAYSLLVALPVVGLLGILRGGRRLTAPLSVAGKWELQADTIRLAALPCGSALTSINDRAITIVQSGKNLRAEIADPTKLIGAGAIEGTTLSLSFQPETAGANAAVCANDRPVTLVANVDPKAEPRSFVGALSVKGCASCTQVEIHAVRTNF